MEELKLKPTKKSPLIRLREGNLKFEGCSIINDPRQFFQPVYTWIEEYIKTKPKHTTIDINFEYIDSSSVKSFFDLLKIFEQLEKNAVVINWFFDYNDPEILELGEIIQSRMKFTFNFIELK